MVQGHEQIRVSYRATACPHRQSIGMVPPTTSVARHLPITVSYTSLGSEIEERGEGDGGDKGGGGGAMRG